MPNIDAIRQSANLYSYVLNNPLAFTDPLGLCRDGTCDNCKSGTRGRESLTPEQSQRMGEVQRQALNDLSKNAFERADALIEYGRNADSLYEKLWAVRLLELNAPFKIVDGISASLQYSMLTGAGMDGTVTQFEKDLARATGDITAGYVTAGVVAGGVKGYNQAFQPCPDRRALYHYTNEKGMKGIVESRQLNPSLKANNPSDVRYGQGQYLSDILPHSKTPPQLARDFINIPNKYKYTHYVEIDVTRLEVIPGRSGVFVIPNTTPLNLDGRIVGYGRVGGN